MSSSKKCPICNEDMKGKAHRHSIKDLEKHVEEKVDEK